MLAEKLTTAIGLGAANTRVRDYADIWTLIQIHDLDAGELRAALEATAEHRGNQLVALSDVVTDLSTAREDICTAYRRRIVDDVPSLPQHFSDVISAVIRFADPILTGAVAARRTWVAVASAWH